MGVKDLLIEWNQRKWEEKNRMMYDQGREENQWPWFSDELDPDVEMLIKQLIPRGARVLDLGTCSGGQAIALAKLGYKLLGTDISETALAKAKFAAARAGVDDIEFVLDDITRSALDDQSFDVILDRGCFHSICCFAGVEYVQQVRRLLKPNGILLLKTMSDQEPRFIEYNQIGNQKIPMPYHFSPAQITQSLGEYFDIKSIDESYFFSRVTNPPAKAYLTVLSPKFV